MSHLQPKFVAKAKSAFKQTRTPHSLPRSMRLTAASSASSATKPRRGNREVGWFWTTFPPDHLQFTLKK